MVITPPPGKALLHVNPAKVRQLGKLCSPRSDSLEKVSHQIHCNRFDRCSLKIGRDQKFLLRGFVFNLAIRTNNFGECLK
mmetsp:Transcript_28559/g.39785  ORF Transcript_28559/g.39785 Transcript_28559/m.39785 type:complete len:80 (-) Transcript_28559:519-758(-)